MTDAASLALLSAATLGGACIQAATGFGFAIIAAPIFIAVIGSTTAIPILVALHVVQSALLVPRLLPQVSRWHLRRLIAGGVIGCPLGLWIFASLSVATLKLAIGIVILAVVALLIVRRLGATGPTAVRARTGPLVATGALAGAMTAVLVMPGPPLMVYFLRQRQSPDLIRATSLTFFALCYVGVALASIAAGALDRSAWVMLAWLSPAVVAGTFAGLALFPRLTARRLELAVLALLLLSGLGALASAIGS